jgi:hypothetical protein
VKKPRYVVGKFVETHTSGLYVCRDTGPEGTPRVFISDGHKCRFWPSPECYFVVEITGYSQRYESLWGKPLFCLRDLEERLSEIRWLWGRHNRPMTTDIIEVSKFKFRPEYVSGYRNASGRSIAPCIRFVPAPYSLLYHLRVRLRDILISHDMSQIQKAMEAEQAEYYDRLQDRLDRG